MAQAARDIGAARASKYTSRGVRSLVVPVAGIMLAAQVAKSNVLHGETESPLTTVTVIGVTPLKGAAVNRNDIAAPIQTASASDIRNSNALDLTAFMNRRIGSVYVNDIQNNALQPDLNYRGYTASPLLGTPQGLSVYLDGMRLNQPFGDIVSWDLIPKDALATMTLIPGSNPVFGANTLGGALTLHTKDGFSDPGYAVEANYGSDRRRRVSVEAGGSDSNSMYWYGTANQLKDDGWRDDSPTDAKQVFAKLGWRGEATDVSLSGAYADADLTGNGLQDIQLLRGDYRSVYTKPDNTRNESHMLNLVVAQQVSSSISLVANAYYRHIDTRTLNGDINDDSLGESLYQPSAMERNVLTAAGYSGFPVSGETQDNTRFPSWRCIANILLNSEPNEKCNGLLNRTGTRQYDAGASVEVTFKTPIANLANKLTIGAAGMRSDAKFAQSSQFGFLTSDRGVGTVNGPGAFADGEQDSENAFDSRVSLEGKAKLASIYFTDTVHLLPSLQLTLSGRYDHTTVDNVDAITTAGEEGSLTAKHTFSRFNPAVGLTSKLTPSVVGYIAYNEGSRTPSSIELGCADPENPCRLPNAMAGDPPLDQVVTHSFEVGVRSVAAARLSWNIGLFRANNRDDIMFIADDAAGFGYFKNFGKTRRQGIEIGMSGQLRIFDFGANYTYLDATYRSEEEILGDGNSTNQQGPGFEGTIKVESGDRIPLTPQHLFKAFVGWDMTERLSGTIDFIAIGSSFARGNENNEHRADGRFYLGSGETGGYAVVNLGLSYRPTQPLQFFAQISNVLDRRYSTGAQLGSTGFNSAGSFVARPFAGPVVDGERPLLGSVFVAPGAPRAYWLGARYAVAAKRGWR